MRTKTQQICRCQIWKMAFGHVKIAYSSNIFHSFASCRVYFRFCLVSSFQDETGFSWHIAAMEVLLWRHSMLLPLVQTCLSYLFWFTVATSARMRSSRCCLFTWYLANKQIADRSGNEKGEAHWGRRHTFTLSLPNPPCLLQTGVNQLVQITMWSSLCHAWLYASLPYLAFSSSSCHSKCYSVLHFL